MNRRTVTRNDSYARQLSLFDLIEERQQEPFPEPAQEETVIDLYGNRLPLVIFQQLAGWADGDTRPEAIERLAETQLLDTTTLYYGPPEYMIAEKDRWKVQYGHSISGYERYRYRCVASGVIDNKAWGAYTYEMCYGDLTRWRNPYESGEDD